MEARQLHKHPRGSMRHALIRSCMDASWSYRPLGPRHPYDGPMRHMRLTVSGSIPNAPHRPPLRRSPVRRNILAGLALALRSDPPAQTRLTNGSGAIVSPRSED